MDLAIVYNSKAVRVSQSIAEDIDSNRFPPGAMLPTEDELASRYGASKSTLRKSLSILVGQGRLVKLPQRGTLVSTLETDQAGANHPKKVSQAISIGLVLALEPDPTVAGLTDGIQKYASEEGLEFGLSIFPRGCAEAVELLRNVKGYSYNGIIVLPLTTPEYESSAASLIGRGYPVVCVDRQLRGLETTSVEYDNVLAGYQGTYYLIRKYPQPPHFLGNALDHSALQDRYNGFRHAMADAGYEEFITPNTQLFEVSDSDPSYWPLERKWLPGFLAAEQMLEHASLPVNVICTNDYTARGLYEAARKRDLRIGEDVRVVGNGDFPMAKLLQPTMTTFENPVERMGYQAARLLHRLITGAHRSPIHIHLPTRLVARESA